MRFQFDVGTTEKHKVEFYFNQFWGNLYVKVDENKIIKSLIVLSFSLVRKYQFTVGEKEKHDVVIEKHRPLMMAGFRPSQYKVFIDGALVQEHRGM